MLPAGLALLGSVLLLQGIRSYKHALGYNLPAVTVLIATKSLQDGHVIALSDLAERPVPQKLTPIGTLLASDRDRVVGLTLTRPVAQGTLLSWSDLDVSYAPSVPAKRVARGYRAVSVSVSELSSVAHSIRRGDHVDLITTLTTEGRPEKTSSGIL